VNRLTRWIRRWVRLPRDRTKRTLVLAIVTSVVFHLIFLLPFVVMPGFFMPMNYVKRGEPLLVDIAPERPEEKAPQGNPSRPAGPEPRQAQERPTPAPPAPRPSAPRPPAPPRVAEAPRPAPVKPPAPAAPPVAKPEPAPEPMVKTMEPRAPQPESTPSQATPAPSAPAQPRVAVARPPASIWRQPGGGGGLQGGGRGGVDGEPIPLDTPEPKFQDYFNQVRDRIKAKWVYPRQAGERNIEGELLIEFHIAKDGRLEFIELRQTSGTQILDDAALTAIKLAQPFPPVPDDIAKRSLAINGQFKYQIVSGLVNQFLR